MDIPTLETPRLILRPFTLDDVDPLHHLMGDPEVMRYFPTTDPPGREQIERLVRGQLAHWEKHDYGWWALELREKPGLIGWSGLQYLPETEEIEIAYFLGRAYWGQGFATEGAQEGLKYGLKTLQLARVVALVHPENLASQRVIQKLGLSLTGPVHYFGMDLNHYWIEMDQDL